MALASAPTAPRFEHRTDAGPVLGLGASTPRLSWTVEQADPGWEQTAYEIEVVRNGTPQVFRVQGREQVLVPWPAPPLHSGEHSEVRVRVAHGTSWSPWGDRATVEAGLLRPSDWTPASSPRRYRSRRRAGARSVRPDRGARPDPAGSAVRHGVRHLPALDQRSTGRRHGPRPRLDVLPAPAAIPRLRRHAPGPARVRTSSRCCSGTGGTAAGSATPTTGLSTEIASPCWPSSRSPPPTAPSTSWPRTAPGGRTESEVLADDLYDGQTTDLRLRDASGVSDVEVEVLDEDLTELVAAGGPADPADRGAAGPPGVDLTRPAGRSSTSGRTPSAGCASGSGVCAAGTEIVIRHAEVLEDGELATRPLRTAEATDRWILSGPEEEVLEPSLTLHGFRYAEVCGLHRLRSRGRRAGRRRLGPAPVRLVLLLERAAEPVPRERGLEHPRQLRGPADRLPAAGRAAGLDRRCPGLRTDRHLPVRHDGSAALLARGPERRAAVRTVRSRTSCRT